MPPSDPCGLTVLYSSSQQSMITLASVIEANRHRSRQVVRKMVVFAQTAEKVQ